MDVNVDIEDIQVKSVYTKTAIPSTEYVANPYVGCPHGCQYCYASFMKRFTKHKEPWGTFVDIKYWKNNLPPPKECHTLMISSVTDPYNPLEEKYKRTQTILKDLINHQRNKDISLLIITKSNLICRDIPLLKKFKRIPKVAFSINTLNEDFKMDMDNAVSIDKRLEAMKTLYENGIKTICFISPIFPEITDAISIIKKVKPFVHYIWLENLQLRGDYKQRILNYIQFNYPKFLPIYEQLYKGNMKNAKNFRNEYWTNYWLKVQNYYITKSTNVSIGTTTTKNKNNHEKNNNKTLKDKEKGKEGKEGKEEGKGNKKEKEQKEMKKEKENNKSNIKKESNINNNSGGKITRSKSINIKKKPY
ncbi:hypothetical protein BCR32DRAFT_265070 [Anaeromyces robustus]|uniref:Radical SAM core domain-containing protein n=1 Tax=Anaeromyces robustus TaxID=1754192 RepID=A0A1Y1XKU5_9FUNG|nr:hypothetical protein BCR32DRAFT_265070 [Anaeromyces robustus]|eukprot:ORX86381.1 hypothetical protein BCR32DRAFT_265070 [Anaeromyces robustus]